MADVNDPELLPFRWDDMPDPYGPVAQEFFAVAAFILDNVPDGAQRLYALQCLRLARLHAIAALQADEKLRAAGEDYFS